MKLTKAELEWGVEEMRKLLAMKRKELAAERERSRQLEARLQDMINVFNAAGIKIKDFPASTLIKLGGKAE